VAARRITGRLVAKWTSETAHWLFKQQGT
jgi:hypothetical protein